MPHAPALSLRPAAIGVALLALAASGRAEAAPTVALYTMGPGDELFSRWGHAELCVGASAADDGECYSYGYADYSNPVGVLWGFVRDQGRYWGAVESEHDMVRSYRRADQSIWRQVLPLRPSQARALADLLRASVEGDAKYYRYNHFHDNCSTRLRDPIDKATDGALSTGTQVADGPPLRSVSEGGLSGYVGLQIAVALGLGREDDLPTSPWQRMLVPAELRAQVQARMGVEPEVVYERKGPPAPHTPHQGRWAVAATGLAVAGLAAGSPRAARWVVALTLGVPALLFWGLALATALPELRWNEGLLCLWPTDLALPALPDGLRRRYLLLRAGALAVVAALAGLGVLIQPLAPTLALVGLPIAALLWKDRRRLRPG